MRPTARFPWLALALTMLPVVIVAIAVLGYVYRDRLARWTNGGVTITIPNPKTDRGIVVKTFSGTGHCKTDLFTVDDDWSWEIEYRGGEPTAAFLLTSTGESAGVWYSRSSSPSLPPITSGYFAKRGTYRLSFNRNGDGPWKVTIYQHAGKIE